MNKLDDLTQFSQDALQARLGEIEVMARFILRHLFLCVNEVERRLAEDLAADIWVCLGEISTELDEYRTTYSSSDICTIGVELGMPLPKLDIEAELQRLRSLESRDRT